ncbi:unnamed protein product [Symbiodinium sp. KB8]|nr:unnamed protein product [Symbiodinium sp. KB8]
MRRASSLTTTRALRRPTGALRLSRPFTTSGGAVSARHVAIGDVHAVVPSAETADLVPHGRLPASVDAMEPATLRRMRWLLQKYAMRQDVLICGPPGPERRRLALEFAELLGLECEIVALSRDTTESDLKQRREILGNGSAAWVDQAPVRAALRGRMLILDGLERAERNVLPTLNNLLEARELSLEDGRLVVSPQRAAALTSASASAAGAAALPQGLVAASDRFWVVALATPSPPYPGRPLDPPLRSRFQSMWMSPELGPAGALSCGTGGAAAGPASSEAAQAAQQAARDFVSAVDMLSKGAQSSLSGRGGPDGGGDRADAVAQLAGVLGAGVAVPTVPPSVLRSCAGLYAAFPETEAADPAAAISRLFPPASAALARLSGGGDDGAGSSANGGIVGALAAALPARATAPGAGTRLVGVKPAGESSQSVVVQFDGPGGRASATMPVSGDAPALSSKAGRAASAAGAWVRWAPQEDLLASMARDLATGLDVALVGAPGSGKTALVREACRRLGLGWAADEAGHSAVSVFPLHSELTARDLLASRDTGRDGATHWRASPLVEAAVRGHIAVLDGAHRLPPDTLASVLGPLLNERSITLPEGTVLAPARAGDAPAGGSDASLARIGRLVAAPGSGALEAACDVIPVHPGFRVVILGEPSGSSAGSAAAGQASVPAAPWLHPEMLGRLAVHAVPDPLLLSDAAAAAAQDSVTAGAAAAAASDALPTDAFVERVLEAAAPRASAQGRAAVRSLALRLREAASRARSAGDGAVPPTLSLRQAQRLARRLPALSKDATATAASDSDAQARGTAEAISRAAWDTLLVQFAPGEVRDVVRTAMARTLQDAALPVPSSLQADLAHSGAAQASGQAQRPRVEPIAEADVDALLAAWPATPGSVPSRDAEGSCLAVRVGDAVLPVLAPGDRSFVPAVDFVDTDEHSRALRDAMVALASGERAVSLIGNQGAGKNRVALRLLELIGREHRYVQLHRDTTVSQLTSTPTLEEGRLVWADSPLIRAAIEGRVVVVDECDKAPTEVLAVIKALLEGHVRLADGRELVDMAGAAAPAPDSTAEVEAAAVAAVKEGTGPVQAPAGRRVVPIHPAFRLVALANRPGWPFLGNDFHASVGDVCSTVVVGALSPAEELLVLRAAAPTTHDAALRAMCAAFAELRSWHEDGRLSYPFSLREAVAVARHMEAFPADGAAAAVRGVLAFDSASPEARGLIEDVMASHGIVIALGDYEEAADPGLAAPRARLEEHITVDFHAAANEPVGAWSGDDAGRRSVAGVSQLRLGVRAWVPSSASVTVTHGSDMRVRLTRALAASAGSGGEFDEEVARFRALPAPDAATPAAHRGSVAATCGLQPGGLAVAVSAPKGNLILHLFSRLAPESDSVLGLGPDRSSCIVNLTPALYGVHAGGLCGRAGAGMWESLPTTRGLAMCAVDTGAAVDGAVALVVPDLPSLLIVEQPRGRRGASSLPDVWAVDLPALANPAERGSASFADRIARATRAVTAAGRGSSSAGDTGHESWRVCAGSSSSQQSATALAVWRVGGQELALADVAQLVSAPGGGRRSGRSGVAQWDTVPLDGAQIGLPGAGLQAVVPLSSHDPQSLRWFVSLTDARGRSAGAVLEGRLGSGEWTLERSVAEGDAGSLVPLDLGAPSALLALEPQRLASESGVLYTAAQSPAADSDAGQPGSGVAATGASAMRLAWPYQRPPSGTKDALLRVAWPSEGKAAFAPALPPVVGHSREAVTVEAGISLSSDSSRHGAPSVRVIHAADSSGTVVTLGSAPGGDAQAQAEASVASIVGLHLLPAPPARPHSPAAESAAASSGSGSGSASLVAAVHASGLVRVLEFVPSQQLRSLQAWAAVAGVPLPAHSLTGSSASVAAGMVSRMAAALASARAGTATGGATRLSVSADTEGEAKMLPFAPGSRPDDGDSLSPPNPSGEPKLGKHDPDNAPHVGGNQWAGGTGGSDTAGLGGRGGPYRLDKGHRVHQVSDEAKAAVPEEQKQRARELARKALASKLAELGMAEEDAAEYASLRSMVGPEIARLRGILASAPRRGGEDERVWVRHETSGELDDAKVVDMVTGSRSVFKRRADAPPPDLASPAGPRPERVTLLLDCSASMYRFNGEDSRLHRELEATAMVMEAAAGLQHRWDLRIVGHSGDSEAIDLMDPTFSVGMRFHRSRRGRPAAAQRPSVLPKSDAERWALLQRVIAHTQFCDSGDHTLPAIQRATRELAAPAPGGGPKGGLVIVVSDANLRRYGIQPQSLARALSAHVADGVDAHYVAIAQFGREGEALAEALPRGRGHVCEDPRELPGVLRRVLMQRADARA